MASVYKQSKFGLILYGIHCKTILIIDIQYSAHAAGLFHRSRVTGHGSRVTGHGSRVTGHGSRVTGQVTGHGSRVTGRGSQVTGHRSRFIHTVHTKMFTLYTLGKIIELF